MVTSSDRALLQIAQVMACSDGSVSDEEEQILMDLPKRLGIQDDDAHEIGSQSLTSLAASLQTHAERCQAARIACLVAGASRNPGDDHDFNADERSAYRELVAALQLEEKELQDIQWSAQEELNQQKSLIQLIGDVLFGAGGWPDPSLLGPEIPGL